VEEFVIYSALIASAKGDLPAKNRYLRIQMTFPKEETKAGYKLQLF
jgi:hypothetical protein